MFSRKKGGRCGFAESMSEERITALKMDDTSVEMTDETEGVSDIIQKAEVQCETYPFSEPEVDAPLLLFCLSCTLRLPNQTHRVPSPVLPIPGVGQVGQGLQNSWGLDEDDEEGENYNSGEEQEEKETKMEEHEKKQSCGGFSLLVLT